jgi:hypothetical protein
MTVPVSVRSVTRLDDQEAARARTACTAMYRPLILNDSKKISAVCSLFSGGFRGGSVYQKVSSDPERLRMLHTRRK